MIRPSGREVTLFNDEHFSQLRQLAGVSDDFVNSGWSFESLESGGAKGGCLMAFLGSEYVVKELSSGDHESLLQVTESYVEHVRGGDTTLCAILLHFQDQATGRTFFAMRNVMGSGPFLAMYDLKGCNDDKTLELFGRKIRAASMMLSHCGTWCGAVGSEYAYDEFSSGKWAAARVNLVVTDAQRKDVLRRIHRDTAWLKSHDLMDYSMLVGVKSGPPGFTEGNHVGRLPLVRSCRDGSEVAVCVGIIDFLQKWDWKKMVARTIKCAECNKATIPPNAYAMRFCEYFEDHFISTTNEKSKKANVEAELTPVAKLPTLLSDHGLGNCTLGKSASEHMNEEGVPLEQPFTTYMGASPFS